MDYTLVKFDCVIYRTDPNKNAPTDCCIEAFKFLMVLRAGIEPAQPKPRDCKSLVSEIGSSSFT